MGWIGYGMALRIWCLLHSFETEIGVGYTLPRPLRLTLAFFLENSAEGRMMAIMRKSVVYENVVFIY